MALNRDLILARFWEHIHDLQALVSAYFNRKITLADIMAKIRKVFKVAVSSIGQIFSIQFRN